MTTIPAMLDFDTLAASITPEQRAADRLQAECALGSMEGVTSCLGQMPLDLECVELAAAVLGEGVLAGLYHEVPPALLAFYRSAPEALIEEMLLERAKDVLSVCSGPEADLQLGIALNVSLTVSMWGPLPEEHPAFATLRSAIERVMEVLPEMAEPGYYDEPSA